jgi:carbon starvation protein
MRRYWFNALLSVVLMWGMAQSGAATAIWPVFGSSNQLLAALALLVVSAWLFQRQGRTPWFTLVPAAFMMATTLYSLALLLPKYLEKGAYLLVGVDLLLFVLALGVIWVAVRARPRQVASAG